MTWTAELPTVPGWYWMRSRTGSISVVELARDPDFPEDLRFADSFGDPEGSMVCPTKGVVWAGPLTPPGGLPK